MGPAVSRGKGAMREFWRAEAEVRMLIRVVAMVS